MQANSINHSLYRVPDPVLDIVPERASHECGARIDSTYGDYSHVGSDASVFHGHFANCMEMYADAEIVAHYLDEHRDWFRRCAQPMTAEALGDNGYALTIGKFASFGYEVEPKIGLDLLPQDNGVYRIQTIPIPDYTPPGYDVDFQAALELASHNSEMNVHGDEPRTLTNVQWELDLNVTIHFPRFINALPHSLIQATGDRLLHQIVRQVSKRLTYKVQQDFHRTMGIPFSQPRRPFWR